MKYINYLFSNLYRILFFLSLFTCLPNYCGYAESSGKLILENDYVRFEFEKEYMGLSAMIDKVSGQNHIQSTEGSHLLWQINFRRGTQEYSLANNKGCRYDPPPQYTISRIENLSDGTQRAVMEWKDVDWQREEKTLTIRVTVDLPDDCGIASWRIYVTNNSRYWGIWSVKFPYFTGFLKDGMYDLARPFGNTGHLYRRLNNRIDASYPGGSWGMQFISLNREDNGIYWAALDPGSQRKDFSVLPGTEGYFINYTEDMGVPGSDYPDFYPVEFGVFRGSWLEACKRYRKWALEQVWTEEGPVSQRKSVPDMIKNVALWSRPGWSFGVDKGTPHQMNRPLLDALEFTGVPMGIQWYNWHQNNFDKDYPHFFPPMHGFRERVKELVDHGVLVVPYINGMIADYDIPDRDEFLPYAVKDIAGALDIVTWGAGSGRTIFMCPFRDFWQDKIVTLVDSLTGYYGTNGVYIDMIAAASPRFCFDESHGHPLGGGRWWIDSFRKLLDKVQNVVHSDGRNAVVTTENTAEPYMNKLDAFLSHIKPLQNDIPMNQAVYSGYTYYFTSTAGLNVSDRAYIMEQGRATLWGLQPGREGFALFKPEHTHKAEFFKRIGEYRVALRDFLSFGELLGPIEPTHAPETITELWTAQYGRAGESATLPGVLGALWRAEDGRLGVYLVNFRSEEQVFSYEINPTQYGLKLNAGRQYVLSEISPEGKVRAGVHYAGIIKRTEIVKPRDFKFIEIKTERN